MRNYLQFLAMLFFGSLVLVSCSEDDDNMIEGIMVTAPESYDFNRDGQSTVSFSGQTTRIQMAQELASALGNFDDMSEETLLAMFRNAGPNGEDVSPFSESSLNSATKSIKSKVAASADYFASNTVVSSQIKADFESWINAQATEVYGNRDSLAKKGVAGQIADGTSARYINEKGLEYNQAIIKSLIGGLMTDQMINNYLSTAVLDAGTNVTDNDNNMVADGEVYTTMEHKWDEAFGYLFGNSSNATNPITTDLGSADSYLNKYLGRVEGDDDFAGIAQRVFDAFKLGRAAIVAKNYTIRDEQAQILRQAISEVIAIRAVYYLQQGKSAIEAENMGSAFHDLSEGFGFVYSLQFTHRNDSNAPYFSGDEVNSMIAKIYSDLEGGFWDVTPTTLNEVSEQIASQFNFTVTEAGS